MAALPCLGEMIASAGDDGNVILWVPSEIPTTNFGSEGLDDKESWRAKHMCRSSGAEIYDLAWSPDAVYFIIGSMDNIARIYNASSGVYLQRAIVTPHAVCRQLTRCHQEPSSGKSPNTVITCRE